MTSSIAALLFDFEPLLTSLDPHHTYTSTPLSGGLVNLTVRVTISPSAQEHECLFKETGSTCVAKYAPPYVATIGENAPFDQFRQIIEARALTLLNHNSVVAYTHSPDHNVSVPRLIHHDTTNHVLLMSDLGSDSVTLDHWLVSPNTQIEDAQTAGTRFGSFFANLTQVDPKPLGLDFSNPGARNLIFDVAVRGVQQNLLKCGIEANEANELARLVLESFEKMCELQREYPHRCSFSLGDCWPPSFLVLDERAEGLAVIDWEFAGMNFQMQDVGQFAAHLYLLYETSSPASRATVRAFALSFLQAHFPKSYMRHYGIVHRAYSWMLFGRELVNNVVEERWFGGDEKKRDEEMRRLGKIGAGFIKDAMELAGREFVASIPPFEPFFSKL
ncbi:phosphotransferase enzyme family protein [Ceratobasidium sp. AG-Ba]|nr:phosphotransferase enzyme family protein [Ceratobasidium sp. AG-Ba]